MFLFFLKVYINGNIMIQHAYNILKDCLHRPEINHIPDHHIIRKQPNFPETLQLTWSIPIPINPNSNIWSFYKFLKIHPLVYNDTLIVTLIVLLVDNTFHIQICHIHIVPTINTTLCKTFQTDIMNTSLVKKHDEKYFTHPIDIDTWNT